MTEVVPENIMHGNCSTIWRGITKVLPLLKENICWSIGKGAIFRCWEDSWVLKIGLLKAYSSPMEGLDLKCLVKDMVTEKGSWDIAAFRNWLKKDIVRKITNIPPSHLLIGPNKFFWIHMSNGEFSVKSAYQMLRESTWNEQEGKWKDIWKFRGPQ
ncbi:hypothetical protein PVK06_040636 [Gossypium arboreum]|uniref:Uncharacterized protein n=1 Tax=Gossypium arboreum TaxID=29729 RepID=A0ABR0N865_GOSAR|nr:hypothetical protein PVK06_040636 [Gossypium arboreum]